MLTIRVVLDGANLWINPEPSLLQILSRFTFDDDSLPRTTLIFHNVTLRPNGRGP